MVRRICWLLAACASGGCQPDDVDDPCADGEAAYTDAGERFDDLSDVGKSAVEASMVLHICAGIHYESFRGYPMIFADYVYDAEEAKYSIVGAGENETILDGEGVHSLLDVLYSDALVSDLTIRNAGFPERDTTDGTWEPTRTSGAGAGVVDANVVFRRVTFEDNVADDGAAFGVYSWSRVTLIDSHIEGNRGEHGGAVALRGRGATLTSENTVWHNNSRADVSFIDENGDRLDSFDGGSGTFTCTWDTVSCE